MISEAPTPSPDHVRVIISVSQSINDSTITPEEAQRAFDIVESALGDLGKLAEKLHNLSYPNLPKMPFKP